MTNSPSGKKKKSMTDTNYVSNYQQYLNSKASATSDDLKGYSDATKTKSIRRKQPTNCKLCKLLTRREDLARILNQGLYNKYTSSLDYYYTKDINSVILKKKKPFTIRFRDDQIFFDEQEYLKKFNRKKESRLHMVDIKNFYTRFKDYPRCFDAQLYRIINAHIRKHRRIEYYKVFKGKKDDERDPVLPEDEQFNFVDMLGESFKTGKNPSVRQVTNESVQGTRPQTPSGQKSFLEIKKNFKELVQNGTFEETDHKFSSDYYMYHMTGVNYYELYSNADSSSAIHDLGDIIEEFAGTHRGQKEQPFKPMIKSEVLGHQKSASTIGLSTIGEIKPGPTSVRASTDLQEAENKANKAEETRALTSKASSQQNSNNPSHDVTPISSATTARIKRYGTLPTNKIIPVASNLKNQNIRKAAEEIKSQSPPKLSYRNGSVEKRENSHRDTQRLEGQSNQVSSNNYRYQPSLAVAGHVSISKSNTGDGTSYLLEEQKKKLLLDIKDLQVNKHNLYKSISNQKWQTTTNKEQVASNVKFFTPAVESSRTTVNKDFQKEGLPSGNRYLITKRSLAATKSTTYEQSSVGNSPTHHTTKHYKNASQGIIEKPSALTSSSKATIDKMAIQDELLQESVRNRHSEIESLSRGSKAYASSKKLLEKVFGTDNNNQKVVAVLAKTPSSNTRQIKILSSQSREDFSGPLSAKNFNSGGNSTEYEKLPSPHRYKFSNGGNKPEIGSSSHGMLAKSNLGKLETDGHYQQQSYRNIPVILSPKTVMPSPTGKLQPYRDSIGGRVKKRNFSTENGHEQYLSPKLPHGMNGQIHARQKSSDILLYGAQTHK